MKNIIIAPIMLLIATQAWSNTREIVDLSINIQKGLKTAKTLRLKVPLGEKASINKIDDTRDTLTIKAIKVEDNKIKVHLKMEDLKGVITNSEIIVNPDKEALLQSFNAEGENDYKFTIKTNR